VNQQEYKVPIVALSHQNLQQLSH